MTTVINCARLFLLVAGMISLCAGCSLIGLPIEITEDVLEDTEVIIEDVEAAI